MPPLDVHWTETPGLGAAVAAVMLLAFTRLGMRHRGIRDVHKRGALVERAAEWRRPSAHRTFLSHPPVTLGGRRIGYRDETKHFKLIGTTGTGKSTAIAELMAGALARGDRAIFADPDAGYLTRFYDRYRGDVVLNPFLPHAHKWNPFREIRLPYDIEELASGLIPTSEDAAAHEWRGYARTLLAAVMRGCERAGKRDCSELWRLLTRAPVEELRHMVAGTAAQVFLEPDNARMFCSIRSVMSSAIGALEHVQGQRAREFSVRDWVACGRGSLFIPYQADQIAALRSMIASWLRLAIFEALSGAAGVDQRIWFVVDELDALGAIDGLKDALTRLRKFGGRCVLGFQSTAQVSATYGADAQTLSENCGNTLILRCSGSAQGGTAHFAAQLIGEREVVRRHTARGRDREGFAGRATRRSLQESEQHTTELAVLPSQLEQLPDLSGYFKSASAREWVRVQLGSKRSWRSTRSR
jgi:type IV secretory pathway TraG/TraD family ATPase VirD4